jgi:hypothetical protein
MALGLKATKVLQLISLILLSCKLEACCLHHGQEFGLILFTLSSVQGYSSIVFQEGNSSLIIFRAVLQLF